MSVAYGQPPGVSPFPARVNFGWITESWQLFMAQSGIWIVATLALIGPSLLLAAAFYVYFFVSMFPGGFPPHAPVPGAALPASTPPPAFTPGNIGKMVTLEIGVGLVMAVYSAFLYGGVLRMAVRQVRGLPLTYRDIFAGGPLFGRMLGAMFLVGLGSYALEIICVGPGYGMLFLRANLVGTVVAIILGFLLVFCLLPVVWGLLLPAFALMADGVPVIPALRRSVQAMKGNWLSAAGFVLVLGLLVYVSEFACGVGLLATIPMIFLTTALAYRDMAGMPDVLPPPSPYYPAAAPGVWPPPPSQSASLSQAAPPGQPTFPGQPPPGGMPPP